MAEQTTKLLEMFPCCSELDGVCGKLSSVEIIKVAAQRVHGSMEITAKFPQKPAPAELRGLEICIAEDFGLKFVRINAQFPEPSSLPNAKAKGKSKVGKTIYGKISNRRNVPISDLTLESGTVTITGDVFAVDSREITRRNAWVLSFDMTDNTGSIHVSKYIQSAEEKSVVDAVKKGMRVTVSGPVMYNRYNEDIAIEPRGIMVVEKPQRMDEAPEKRVELHLHTRFSTMDALTDPDKLMATAARWGHKAVAVTDHGIAQAFPDFWKASKQHGVKAIFGIEGYFLNDVDGHMAVKGPGCASLDDEFVAFDLETTGLSSARDRITEIGAVLYKGGEIIDRFETFVNPEMPIPAEITKLTGITDRDVFDAPSESEAVLKFLDFVGNRPLSAHNAEFDVGFIRAACRRMDMKFAPLFIDTLIISRGLMPTQRKHSLNVVAERLGLSEFRHHRAMDDAVTVMRIMECFRDLLREKGANNTDEVRDYIRDVTRKTPNFRDTRHIILLVQNKVGLKNLYKLISKAHLEYFNRSPVIPKTELIKHREGIIVGSACEAGEIIRKILDGAGEDELKSLAAFYDFLEIQPICNNNFLMADGRIPNEEGLRDINRKVVELGRIMGKPIAATGDVHFLEPEDEIYRHILLNAKGFSDADKALPIYFKTTTEMLEEFSYLGEETAHEVVIKTPNAIADMCEEIELFPKDLFAPTIENSVEDLKALVYGRMHELYGENPPELVKSRVDTEMKDIIDCKYDVIYMSAQKLVSNSLAAGYLVGSRGSVGSSIVAYMSGITEVNSLPAHYRCPQCQYSDFESGKGHGCGADMPDMDCPHCGTKMDKDGFDIPFETFLGFNGDKIPDIDLNFSGEYQATAHKYTEELFGSEHVFKAGTIGTLAEKTAYGYVKKYLEAQDKIVTKAEENRLALGCVGVKRTTGQHPGGLVIIPQDMDVTDFCPIQHPADSADSGIITTHFEYHSMEDNLLKLDELGHDDPTMIKMLEDMTGVDAKKIPLDDSETRLIFKSPLPLGLPDDDPIIGKTGSIGIPEFGTGFTRGMLNDTQPDKFDTLVRLSGFSHGTDVWLGNAKDLILDGTADISQTIGCRDDIMLFLISCGMDEKLAFKIMEAVRKGRGLQPEWESEMKKINVPAWYIESCKKIKYLFPKAHAVAYVMMAFRIAWFKVHKPLAYYAAYFYRRVDTFDAMVMTQGIDRVRRRIKEISNNQMASNKELDMLTTLEAVYEFYLRGFEFDPIDLYKSDAGKFIISDDWKRLRPPFVSVSGLGETAALDLVACREGNKEFISIQELQGACSKVSQTNLEQLKNLGALGDLPDTSQISLF